MRQRIVKTCRNIIALILNNVKHYLNLKKLDYKDV